MENIGEARRDEATQLLSLYLRAQSCFHLGELVSARALRERCRGLSDPAHRAACAAVTVEDPLIVNRAWLGATLAMLGYIDQARADMDAALSDAHRLGHAYTIAWVLMLACWVDAIVGSPHGLLRHGEELVTVSEEHGFPHMLGQGLYNRGRALVALGQAREGLTLITKALSGRRAIGSLLDTPRVLCFLAEAHAKLEQLDEGLKCLTEAERSEERTWEAEVCRVRGDLLYATGDRSAAEHSYRQAVDVAKRQSAKPFELRASTSLARLWRDEGKRTEARVLLAPICGWFTEVFDTPDLKEAKALLDELR
jgi:predicted ATPase